MKKTIENSCKVSIYEDNENITLSVEKNRYMIGKDRKRILGMTLLIFDGNSDLVEEYATEYLFYTDSFKNTKGHRYSPDEAFNKFKQILLSNLGFK